MQFHLKKDYSQLKVFLGVSLFLGFALCTLQFLNSFTSFDTLLIALDPNTQYTSLPTNIMIFIIMFHTFLPGFIIFEEGASKGILYIVIIWFFYIVLSYTYASSSSIYIPLLAPLLGCIISTIRVLAWEESFLQEEKAGMRKTLGTYIEPQIAEMLISNPNLCYQDGIRKTVTILFADLRGFTQLCENIAPEVVISILRECFGKMITIARIHGGTVDKLIGDSMMVVWGNPIPMTNHAENAVQAAIEMQTAMEEINRKWQQRLGINLMLGIGINTDEVVAGTIGSEEFCDYTVLGSGVNLAARLEAACPGNEICVSPSTYAILKNFFTFSEVSMLADKHYDRPVPAHRVLFRPTAHTATESEKNYEIGYAGLRVPEAPVTGGASI